MAFHAADWVVFAALLLISLGMGAFFWFRDRKTQSMQQYLLGGRQMHLFPVTLSLTGSFISALAMLGMPAEVYQYGYVYIWHLLAAPLQAFVVAFLIIPVYEQIKITSIFEYLEMRFSESVRLVGAGLYVLEMLLYLSLVLYMPCTSVETTMGLNRWIAVAIVGLTCTTYTTFGGLKAVVWSDVFQVSLMFLAMTAVFIQGFIVSSGAVFSKSAAGGRLNLDNFSIAPWERHTFWSLSVGGAFLLCGVNGCSQTQIQKLLSLPTLKKAQIAVFTQALGWMLAVGLCSTCGLIMYAVYGDCDPVLSKRIQSYSELVPLFVDEFLNIPGIPGLIVAGLFSASLSTLAGGFTALAAVCMRDIVKRLVRRNITEKSAARTTKCFTLAFGLTCTLLTYPLSKMGNMLQASLSIFGWTGGPMIGLFTLGMFFPWTNWIGAHAGFWTSLLLVGWVYLGYYVLPVVPPTLDFSVAGCENNVTLSMTSMKPYPEGYTGVTGLYTLSYMWYGAVGWVICLTVGLTVSLLTGKQDVSKLNPKLVSPVFVRLFMKNVVMPADGKDDDVAESDFGPEDESASRSSSSLADESVKKEEWSGETVAKDKLVNEEKVDDKEVALEVKSVASTPTLSGRCSVGNSAVADDGRSREDIILVTVYQKNELETLDSRMATQSDETNALESDRDVIEQDATSAV